MKKLTGSRLASVVLGLLAIGAPALAGCDGGGDGGEGGGGGAAAGGSVKVQISGEELGTDGFLFPQGSEVTIADGWEVKFTHVLVSVEKAWLSENPDMAPSDQSQTGATVAELAGPWVVDLAKEGDEPGAGGEGTAFLLGTIDKQNANGDAPLAVGERYAFSYELAVPGEGAKHLNIDAEAETLVEEMKSKGYTSYYAGTATFKGTACESSDATYDFTKLPQTFEFALGFTTPVSLLNCQNEENQGEPFDGEEFQRGITIRENEASLAQMTMHLDHFLYSATDHEPSLYFDQLAALLVGKPAGTVLTMEDAEKVDPLAFTDAEGAALPWRACDGSTVPGNAQRAFDLGTVPFDPAGSPGEALRHYRDYIHYVASSQGHLNGGEGICFTKRNYPSPD